MSAALMTSISPSTIIEEAHNVFEEGESTSLASEIKSSSDKIMEEEKQTRTEATPVQEIALYALQVTPLPNLEKLSFQKERNIFVFDWDDTLFATSWLQSWVHSSIIRPTNVNDAVVKAMKTLEKAVSSVLIKAAELGDVFVITNSEMGWVELTAELWIPAVLPLLKKVQIISARSSFESSFPDAPLHWKIEACRSALNSLDAPEGSPINVISIGDSVHDHQSASEACRLHQEQNAVNTMHKWVKVLGLPLLAQVRSTLEILAEELERICFFAGDLSLCVRVPGTSFANELVKMEKLLFSSKRES